jgi:hypothetical protein
MPQQPESSKRHHVIKWSAAAVFAGVVLAAAGLIAYVMNDSQAISITPERTGSKITPPTDVNVGSPAPAAVVNGGDLRAVEVSLDSANLDSINTELEANDADLSEF